MAESQGPEGTEMTAQRKVQTMNSSFENSINKISAEDFAALGSNNMVYVREVNVDDLKGEMTAMEPAYGGSETLQFPDDQRFFAIHLADGTRVAVLTSRDAAFFAARQHNMSPVSVH